MIAPRYHTVGAVQFGRITGLNEIADKLVLRNGRTRMGDTLNGIIYHHCSSGLELDMNVFRIIVFVDVHRKIVNDVSGVNFRLKKKVVTPVVSLPSLMAEAMVDAPRYIGNRDE